MNNNIRTIALTVGAPILALIATMFLFTGRGNLVAAGYKFYVPIFFVLCLMRPRVGLPLCVLLATLGDLVKRLMLFDTRISEQDIAYVLLLVPAGISGLIIYALFDLFRNWQRESKTIKIILAFSLALAAATLLGRLAGGAGMRSFGNAINSSLYMVFMGCVPILLKDRQEIIKILKYTIIVFIPVALYGIKQGVTDLADFEYAYLESGLTIESRQLEETVIRVMSTLGTAVALSSICGCFAGLSFSSLALNKKMNLSFSSIVFKLLLGTVFFICTYYTFTRVGYVCCLVAFCVAIGLRSKFLTIGGISAVVAALVVMYAMADQWWQEDVLRDIQEEIVSASESDDEEIEQTAKLVTWNARLESMSHFMNKGELWTPFGLKAAGKEDLKEGLWIHDPLTEILVSRGYVIMVIMILCVIYVIFRVLRFYWSIPPGLDEKLLRFCLAGGFGVMATAASHGISLFLFPINLMWALFIGSAFSLSIMIINERKHGYIEEEEVVSAA